MLEKLVRDNIPEIIRNNGDEPITRILNEDEYIVALDEKLREEVAEYLENNDISELPDILEVIRAIATARGSSIEKVEAEREIKFEERGGFEQRISLISEKK